MSEEETHEACQNRERRGLRAVPRHNPDNKRSYKGRGVPQGTHSPTRRYPRAAQRRQGAPLRIAVIQV